MKVNDKITGVSHITTLYAKKSGRCDMAYVIRNDERIETVTGTVAKITGKKLSFLKAMELLMKDSDKETEIGQFMQAYSRIAKAREKCLNESERSG